MEEQNRRCVKCGKTLILDEEKKKELCYGCREKELLDMIKCLEKTIDYYRKQENQYCEKYFKYKNACEVILETLIKKKR